MPEAALFWTGPVLFGVNQSPSLWKFLRYPVTVQLRSVLNEFPTLGGLQYFAALVLLDREHQFVSLPGDSRMKLIAVDPCRDRLFSIGRIPLDGVFPFHGRFENELRIMMLNMQCGGAVLQLPNAAKIRPLTREQAGDSQAR